MRRTAFLSGFAIFLALTVTATAAEMRLAVTTSFHNSGLADILLPQIKKDIGLDVRLLVVGTGQALRLARAGDVDAVLVHSRKAEEKFVAEGYGTHRREIMYNDFILIGPGADPAAINKTKTAAEALSAIATTKSAFVSRGDDSGTHRKELSLWISAGIDVKGLGPQWYRDSGSGMAATLNTASGMNAYVMSDRGSWIKFANKGALKLLFSGDPVLFNQYAYMPVNPVKHSHVKHDLAIKLEDWLASMAGQALIGGYQVDGEILFTPNATDAGKPSG